VKSKALIGTIFLVLVLVVVPFMTACPGTKTTTPSPTTSHTTTPPTQEVKTLRIGSLNSLTGWFSTMDIQTLNETEIVLDLINEGGGITINGQKYQIELVVEDCKSSLDGVTAAANKLVYDEKIDFIIGPAAFFSMAAAPVCDPNEVIHVLGYCVHSPLEIGPQVPYGFLGNGGMEGRMIAVLNVFRDEFPEYKKFAFVSAAGGLNDTIQEITYKMMDERGYTIVGDWLGFPDDTTDYSPYVTTLNSIEEADAIVMLHAIASHAGNILKGLRGLGNEKVVALMASSPGNVVRSVSGVEAADNFFTVAPVLGAPGNPPVLEELLQRLYDKYGADCPNYLEQSAALYVLVKVIEDAQSLDPTVVKEHWESMNNVDTLFGAGVLCGDEAYGITHHYVSHPQAIQWLRDGEVVFDRWDDIGFIP
jgi:branched-chain amino acid transport system substrate-binding protein